MPDVTRIFAAIEAGDPQAAEQLVPLVYDELRKLAAGYLLNEAPGQTLDATGLVHEVYLRLIGPAGDQTFANRAHFFAAAANAMRRILLDAARRKQSLKRGGGQPISMLHPDLLSSPRFEADLWIDLDDAITAFEAVDPSAADLAKLRLFSALSVEEAGEVLGMPRATAFRVWTYARAWLTATLSDRTKDL
jgi:RNA polymerase sigma factor (TIGR02999 family)